MMNNAYRIAAVFTVTLMTAVNASAQSFVVPPESLPGGLSYEQWSAKWWQWAFAIPASMSPIGDTTGVDCAVNQSGPVWFLAGTGGFTATRNCVVPAGKMIFFPIVNFANDYPCLVTNVKSGKPFQRRDPNFQPGPGQSLEQFLTIGYGPILGARQFLDHVTALSATLDGIAVQGLSLPPVNSQFRATSPMFEFNSEPPVPNGDPCVGNGHKAVSDGYWIMLAPPSPGPHTLHFLGTETFSEFPPPNTFTVDVTYKLTVAN